MKIKRITAVLLIVLLFATLFTLTGCGGGISHKQRESYLEIAKEYEAKANDAQSQALLCRLQALTPSTLPAEIRRSFEAIAKQYDDVAQEYRELAFKYRELATK